MASPALLADMAAAARLGYTLKDYQASKGDGETLLWLGYSEIEREEAEKNQPKAK